MTSLCSLMASAKNWSLGDFAVSQLAKASKMCLSVAKLKRMEPRTMNKMGRRVEVASEKAELRVRDAAAIQSKPFLVAFENFCLTMPLMGRLETVWICLAMLKMKGLNLKMLSNFFQKVRGFRMEFICSGK